MKKIDEGRAVPNWRSAFWRIVYFISGVVLLISGRIWMSGTDEATILPMLTMLAGGILIMMGVRAWPRRARF